MREVQFTDYTLTANGSDDITIVFETDTKEQITFHITQENQPIIQGYIEDRLRRQPSKIVQEDKQSLAEKLLECSRNYLAMRAENEKQENEFTQCAEEYLALSMMVERCILWGVSMRSILMAAQKSYENNKLLYGIVTHCLVLLESSEYP